MLRTCKYVAAWMAAAAVAVTVSWLGVRVGLAPALTAESPVAIDVNRRYTEVHLGFDDVTPAPSVSSTPSRPRPSKSATAAPRPTTTTKRPTPKPSVTPAPSVHPSTSAPDEQKEYQIAAEGGTAIVAYSASRVDAVETDPIDGYVASYTRRSDTTIVIRLDGPVHSSVITAYWLDGPHARIAEEYAG